MPLRAFLKNLIRPDAERPSLRERAADLRASLSRRTVVVGSVAAAVPLPAIAAPVVAAPAQPHPDAELVALGERWLQARAAQDEAMEAWGVASGRSMPSSKLARQSYSRPATSGFVCSAAGAGRHCSA